MKIDDALGPLSDDVAQIGSAIFVVDVVVQDVLTDVLLARVVKTFEHGIQGTFQSHRVGLKVGFHQVNASQESGVISLAEGHHEALDAVAHGHAANQAVVQWVDVVEEVALRLGVLGVFPPQKFRQIRVGLGFDQLVLLGHQLHLLVCNLFLHLCSERAVLELLAEASDLVVVDPSVIFIGEPTPVFRALGSGFAAGQLLGTELEHEVCLVRIEDELAVVLGIFGRHLVEPPVHLNGPKVKGLVLHFCAVHQGQVAALRLVQIQLGAVGCGNGAMQPHVPFFVPRVLVGQTGFPACRNTDVRLT